MRLRFNINSMIHSSQFDISLFWVSFITGRYILGRTQTWFGISPVGLSVFAVVVGQVLNMFLYLINGTSVYVPLMVSMFSCSLTITNSHCISIHLTRKVDWIILWKKWQLLLNSWIVTFRVTERNFKNLEFQLNFKISYCCMVSRALKPLLELHRC